MRFTLQQWADASDGEILAGDPGVFVGGEGPGGLSIDSRTILENEWFIALTGKKGTDGHLYLSNAVCKGAGGLIISDREEYQISISNSYPDLPVLLVRDTTLALGDAARSMLEFFRPFVIAITGSVGKTTVKENIAHVSSVRWHTLRTLSNWNTEIGLPLTVFKIREEHKVVVLECAARGAGQIRYLTGIARPDIAIITMIGPGHLSEFGSINDIARAKWEIAEGVRDGGTVVVNEDVPFLDEYREKLEGRMSVVTFGYSSDCDFFPTEINRDGNSTRFNINAKNHGLVMPVRINGVNPSDVINSLCTAACAMEIRVKSGEEIESLDVAEIAKALGTTPSIPGRMEIIARESGVDVLFDAYNSNPSSLKNAIETLGHSTSLHDGSPILRKVAVLGDMLELGLASDFYHHDAADILCNFDFDVLITVGDLSWTIRNSAQKIKGKAIRGDHYDTTEECAENLHRWIRPGDLVLVKASRGLSFEKLLEGSW